MASPGALLNNFPPMLTNYLKIAIRSLLKHKVYSFINITGLSMGMTVSILILIFVVTTASMKRATGSFAQKNSSRAMDATASMPTPSLGLQ